MVNVDLRGAGRLTTVTRRLFGRAQLRASRASSCNTEVDGPQGYAFSRIDRDRITRDAIFAVKNRTERFLTRWDSPHLCYGYTAASGEVASYVWLSIATDAVEEVPFRFGLSLALQPQQAYIWDCATDPAHQNKGLYRCALRHARALAERSGATQVYICTDVGNHASYKGVCAAGFTPYREITVSRASFCRRVEIDGKLVGVFFTGRTLRIFDHSH